MISIVLLRCWISICLFLLLAIPCLFYVELNHTGPACRSSPSTANSPHLAAPALPAGFFSTSQARAGLSLVACLRTHLPLSTFSWNASSTLCKRKSGSPRACCSQVKDRGSPMSGTRTSPDVLLFP